jgi:hypothetical protein
MVPEGVGGRRRGPLSHSRAAGTLFDIVGRGGQFLGNMAALAVLLLLLLLEKVC